MKKIRKFKIKNNVIEVEVCDTIFKRARGLMFRKSSLPLLFVFNKPTLQPIHSFFCKPFRAIWLKNSKIIDEKVIRHSRLSIRPKEPFTHLVEILLKNNNNPLQMPSGK